MDFLPLATFAPILIAVGYNDLRYMRIPNVLSLLGVGLFVFWAIAMPPSDLVARLILAAIVFVAGFIGFAFRILGGGDVKALAVLMLFIPVQSLIIFANVLSASLILGITAMIAIRNSPVLYRTEWKGLSAGDRFPMGISIAFAGIVHPAVVGLLDTAF